MPPAKCPYLNRCNKYAELTCRIDRQRDAIAEKDRELARLRKENEAPKAAQCGGRTNPAKVLPFGSSTPSSRIPVKENSSEESRKRMGGLKAGHAGHGRKRIPEAEADEVVDLPAPRVCPIHGNELTEWTTRTKTVVHSRPARAVTRVYTIQRAWCPRCRKYHEGRIPGVMPYFAFSNDLLAQALVDHYRHGIPMGTIARRLRTGKSALFNAAKRIAQILEPGLGTLREDFRKAENKHADETTWPNDGRNGYAWGFFTENTSLYAFKGTRASSVPKDVFGDGEHIGVLGVDRYGAYNASWKGKMQYCLEHYKRNVRDLMEAEPGNKEYNEHVPRYLELLKVAMTLRTKKHGKEYDEESLRIRDELLALCSMDVKDGKLKGYFDLMKEKSHRFFQWVCHPEIEAENNLAERRLRPLVTARKVCFGSQSEKGLEIRETLMSIIDTLSLRFSNPVQKISSVFDEIARNRNVDVSALLWSKTPCRQNA